MNHQQTVADRLGESIIGIQHMVVKPRVSIGLLPRDQFRGEALNDFLLNSRAVQMKLRKALRVILFRGAEDFRPAETAVKTGMIPAEFLFLQCRADVAASGGAINLVTAGKRHEFCVANRAFFCNSRTHPRHGKQPVPAGTGAVNFCAVTPFRQIVHGYRLPAILAISSFHLHHLVNSCNSFSSNQFKRSCSFCDPPRQPG